MKNVLEHLNTWASDIAHALRKQSPADVQQHADLIALKTEIEAAIGRLELCERWGITSKSMVRELPIQKTRSPSSEYRIMEDCETENRALWVEADFQGRKRRFNEGDLIIQR